MVISAGGVVIKDECILLLKNQTGRWVLPKGHVEEKESLRMAAKREVFEESGIEAKIEQKLGWMSYDFTFDGIHYDKKVLWFRMREISGTPTPLGKEGFVRAEYIPFDRVRKLFMHESEKEIIERAMRAYKK